MLHKLIVFLLQLSFLKKLDRHLKPGGMLVYLLSDEEDRDAQTERLLKNAGFTQMTVRDDLVSVRKLPA